jgi:hypothetical protein
MAANLEIGGAVKRTQQGDADWYYGGDNEAWTDLASAKAGVPAAIRPGKTVGVYISGVIVEYWWPTSGSVADGDLIVKTADLSGKADITYVDSQDTAEATARAAADTTIAGNLTAGDAATLTSAKSYADGLLVSVYKDCGNWDASTGSFPTTGGTGAAGAIKSGNAFEVSVAGTAAGESFDVGDIIRALIDTPGQTVANWAVSEHNTQQATETNRGTAKIVDQATIQTETSTDDAAVVTTKKFWLGIARLVAIAQTITGAWNFTGGLQSGGNAVETQNNKDANSGYAGLDPSGNFNKTSDKLIEGTTNLYFTIARVLGSALTGYGLGTNTALAATDTVLAAFGKIQAQLNSKINLTGISATAPILYDNTTGIVSSQAASATQPGHVTTGAQTIAGNKTFNGNTTFSAKVSFGGTSLAVAGIGTAINYNATVQATANNDSLFGLDLTATTFDAATGGGSIVSFSSLVGGSGYVNGTYNSVPLTGGSGTGATVQIVVSGGGVTGILVTISQGVGNGYKVGDVLSASNTNLGGSGSGFSVTLLAANLTFTGVTPVNLRCNSMIPSVNMGAANNIGSSALAYNIAYIGRVYTNSVFAYGHAIDFRDQSGILVMNLSTGSANIQMNGTLTDAGYKLDLAAGTTGSIRTTGAITAASNIARGNYFNNSLAPITNNDVLVGLDINNTFNLGPTAIQALGTITGGTGHGNGTWAAVPLTGGTGTGATANITVAGGVVTGVTLVNHGSGYTIGDTLSSSSIGGGTGFSVPVSTIGLTGTSYLSLRTSGGIASGGEITGNKLNIPTTGANAAAGTATLVAGTVTINTTAIKTGSIVMLTRNTPGGTIGDLSAPIASFVAGTSFVINSGNAADTSTVNWIIIN